VDSSRITDPPTDVTFVLGRDGGLEAGPTCELGRYRAIDGSRGAPVHIDVDAPHAMLVVGKRGYGKSHTLGVVAESLARTGGLAPVVLDPMGDFRPLAEPLDQRDVAVPATVVDDPAVAPDSLDPRSWCSLLGLSPESAPGSLVWQAGREASTVAGMRDVVESASVSEVDSRAATNHLDLADSWGVFDPAGLTAEDLAGPEATVLDVSGLDPAPMNAVVRGVCECLYRARVEASIRQLPWVLVDEAHTFLDGVAETSIRTLLTRGRGPGISLVLATQRPGVVPQVAVSQSDVVVAHRVTSTADREALRAARPCSVTDALDRRMPTDVGDAVVVDDSTETVHAVTVRQRETRNGGTSPRASDVAGSG
jgi:DNA helicase HerA-like ATPase